MGVRINDLTEECDMGEAPAAHDDNGDSREPLLAQVRELYGLFDFDRAGGVVMLVGVSDV